MRSARAFDPVLGQPLVEVRCADARRATALDLCFEGAPTLRLVGAQDGVSLACVSLVCDASAPGECPPALAACIGRRLLAASPSVHEYESVHDGLEASGVVLEFEGGRRVWIHHSCGELVIDRTGRAVAAGGGDAAGESTRRTG